MKLLTQKTNYLKIGTIFLFLLFLEITSFVGYLNPEVNVLVFSLILFFTLILSWQKLEYGIYIILAELFIGSKGYLFFLPVGEKMISLRIALFVIMMLVWGLKLIIVWFKKHSWPDNFFEIRKSKFFKYYLILALCLIWGVVWGLIRKNSLSNLFFDFNGWLYFILVIPFFDIIKTEQHIQNIFKILSASLLIVCFKTVFLFWVFTHNLVCWMQPLYRWMSDNYIGEISLMSYDFYRVFIQSQIFVLVGFFVFLVVSLRFLFKQNNGWFKNKNLAYVLTVLSSLTLLISFSRSFWVGLLAGIILLLILSKKAWPQIKISLVKIVLVLILIAVSSAVLALGLANLPKPSGEVVSLTSLVEKRLTQNEVAGMSRLNLIQPLLKAIAKHPVIGSGFGQTVTYQSLDPRNLKDNSEGWYTTFAFEWGYFDIWLKIGLVGLMVYLFLIWQIIKSGWQNRSILNISLILGLVAVLVTSFFSPYLNHPLGIGYLILCSVIFEK
ncbi:MAG: O-antigen ligase family protein [Patescibacteria group bacterium]|nr:O-antigen ligase family protein [Patescibacteria group bacterium]